MIAKISFSVIPTKPILIFIECKYIIRL